MIGAVLVALEDPDKDSEVLTGELDSEVPPGGFEVDDKLEKGAVTDGPDELVTVEGPLELTKDEAGPVLIEADMKLEEGLTPVLMDAEIELE